MTTLDLNEPYDDVLCFEDLDMPLSQLLSTSETSFTDWNALDEQNRTILCQVIVDWFDRRLEREDIGSVDPPMETELLTLLAARAEHKKFHVKSQESSKELEAFKLQTQSAAEKMLKMQQEKSGMNAAEWNASELGKAKAKLVSDWQKVKIETKEKGHHIVVSDEMQAMQCVKDHCKKAFDMAHDAFFSGGVEPSVERTLLSELEALCADPPAASAPPQAGDFIAYAFATSLDVCV